MVAPAGCILHATSCTGTCGRATSAQAQALCRDAPPKLWIVARAHAVLHCSTLLVAHIKSEFAKCTFAEVSQTRPLQAPAASAVAPTDGRTPPTFACVWTLHRKLQHPCIRTCSPATALPCLAQWGSRQTIASLHRCTLCCVEEGGAPSLACVAPHAAASAADDMVYNLASACKRPGRASYLGNSKVDFCRSFIFPRRTAVNTRCGRVAVPEESSA